MSYYSVLLKEWGQFENFPVVLPNARSRCKMLAFGIDENAAVFINEIYLTSVFDFNWTFCGSTDFSFHYYRWTILLRKMTATKPLVIVPPRLLHKSIAFFWLLFALNPTAPIYASARIRGCVTFFELSKTGFLRVGCSYAQARKHVSQRPKPATWTELTNYCARVSPLAHACICVGVNDVSLKLDEPTITLSSKFIFYDFPIGWVFCSSHSTSNS